MSPVLHCCHCSNTLICHYSLRVRQTYWSTPGAKSKRISSRSTMLRSPVTWVKAAQWAAPPAQSPRADAASRPFPRRPPGRRSSLMRTTKDPQSCSGALLAPTSRPLLCSCLLSSKPKALCLYPGITALHAVFFHIPSCTFLYPKHSCNLSDFCLVIINKMPPLLQDTNPTQVEITEKFRDVWKITVIISMS